MSYDPQLERYSRQMRFAGIREQGQKKLLTSRVTLCGCGASSTTRGALRWNVAVPLLPARVRTFAMPERGVRARCARGWLLFAKWHAGLRSCGFAVRQLDGVQGGKTVRMKMSSKKHEMGLSEVTTRRRCTRRCGA